MRPNSITVADMAIAVAATIVAAVIADVAAVIAAAVAATVAVVVAAPQVRLAAGDADRDDDSVVALPAFSLFAYCGYSCDASIRRGNFSYPHRPNRTPARPVPAARRHVAPVAIARARCAASWPIVRLAAQFPLLNNHNPIDDAMRHDDADAPDDVPDDDGAVAVAAAAADDDDDAVAAAVDGDDDDGDCLLAFGQRWRWPLRRQCPASLWLFYRPARPAN